MEGAGLRFRIMVVAGMLFLAACGGSGTSTLPAAAPSLPGATLPSCDTTYTTNLHAAGGYLLFPRSSFSADAYYTEANYFNQTGNYQMQVGTITCFDSLPGPAKSNEKIVAAWSLVSLSPSPARATLGYFTLYGSYPSNFNWGGNEIGVELYENGKLGPNTGGGFTGDNSFKAGMINPFLLFPNTPVYIELVERP